MNTLLEEVHDTDTSSPTCSTTSNAQQLMDEALNLAIKEDMGMGKAQDVTTDATVPESMNAIATFYCKEKGVIAGQSIMQMLLNKYDSRLKFTEFLADGTSIEEIPTAIGSITGPARSVLSAERVALNILQRMSGIATITKKYVEQAESLQIQIKDTRKTTPGLRAFERLAVTVGGGTNHRFGLFDAILIKDNHVKIAGGVTPAVRMARKKYPQMPVEVEVTSLQEVQEAIDCQAETILLDNMNPTMIKRSIAIIDGRSFIEVSGGVNLKNLNTYLLEGVGAISVGALTHSAPSIDISLEIESCS